MFSRKHKKWIVIVFIDLFIILGLIGYLGIMKKNAKIHGVYIQKPIDIDDFQLIDHHANLLTKNNLKGHWTFLFLGFTQCKMICPTTLATLNKMYLALQKDLPATKLPKIIFITIDPEHDSIHQLNTYVNSFNKNFIGARIDLEQTRLLAKNLRVTTVYDNGDINHTSDIILLNPEVKIQAYFPFPAEYQKLVDDYKALIRD